MRRRPPSRVISSNRRAVADISPSSGAAPDSLALFLDASSDRAGQCSAGPGSRESAKDSDGVRCRTLQHAIDQVTQKFEEAQQEYQSVAANSPDSYKWKGEMIAYANAVALLENLKSRYALVL
jgi:hypothetical protein